jgi:pimeloyl-ACP methyl ester carboxylesterase
MTTQNESTSSQFVQIDSLKLHYLETGQGDPVVLLHGWPTSSYMWRKAIPVLAKTHRVIALDLPGFGQSDKPLDVTYTTGYHAGSLAAFVEALGLERLSLVVHDLGAPVGLLWAVRHLDKVQRLVIMNTLIDPDPRHLSFPMRMFFWAARIPGLRNLLVSPRGIALTMRLGTASRLPKDVIAAYQAPFRTRKARRVLLKTLLDPDFQEMAEVEDALPTLGMPTAVIYGKQDAFFAAEMRRIGETIPHAEVTALRDCNHFLIEDQPEQVSETLAAFLAG